MHRPGLVRWVAVAPLVLLLPSCDEPRVAPGPPPAPPADKATLFGDPSLVPTRTGERAREELGLAQEVAGALRMLPTVEGVHVDVELPRRADDPPPRVLAVARSTDAADVDRLTARVDRIARAVVGPRASVEVIVEASPPAPSDPEPTAPWALVLGLLGLGYFAGTLVERTRRLRRPTRGRRAR